MTIVPHVSGEDSMYLKNPDIAVAHRISLTSCPWCRYEPVEMDKTVEYSMERYNQWYRHPWIKEIVLNNTYHKVGCCVVVSICPECRELSWLHRQLDKMGEMFLPKSTWYKEGEEADRLRAPLDPHAIWAEINNRALDNMHTALSAICHGCSNFYGIVKDYDSFWSHDFICGRDGEYKKRCISFFQKPGDCNAYNVDTIKCPIDRYEHCTGYANKTRCKDCPVEIEQ